jgi:hypothetical protein
MNKYFAVQGLEKISLLSSFPGILFSCISEKVQAVYGKVSGLVWLCHITLGVEFSAEATFQLHVIKSHRKIN